MVVRINNSETSFTLGAEEAAKLRKQGVPEVVIDAMYARQTGERVDPVTMKVAPATVQPAVHSTPIAAGPAMDVFGGYSFVSADANSLSTSRQNASGWEASTTVYARPWIGVEGNFSGYYKGYSTGIIAAPHISVRDYGIMGGPHLSFRYGFAHVLFGSDNLSGSVAGLSASQTSFAIAMGGGVEARISEHWSVRPSFDYVLTHHNVLGGPRVQQNNIRFGAGVAYSFGSSR
jgi:hypothetical protein